MQAYYSSYRNEFFLSACICMCLSASVCISVVHLGNRCVSCCIYMHLSAWMSACSTVYSMGMCVRTFTCSHSNLWPMRVKIQMGGQCGTQLTFSLALCVVRRYLYLEWTIEKDGFDFPAVASGSAFLWVQSQPPSDALIGARSFVPNSVSLHPWTSRNR